MRRIKKFISAITPWQIKRLVYRWLAMRYIKELEFPHDSSRKTIVILNHFFDQDVRALDIANKDFNFVVINSVTLFRGAKLFFNADVRELRAPYNQADPVRLSQYRKECRLMFVQLQKRTDVDLIVTASDIFYWVREFISVARDKDVETVVLDKEGTRTPHAFFAEAERIRKFAPFMSKRIFVWSERQREFWNRIGAKENQISIVGQPRSDLLHREERYEVDRLFPKPQSLVTLFSYKDDAYIPTELIQTEKLSWEMKQPTHDEFYLLACEHPEHNFVIKTHPQQPDLPELQQRYNRENLMVVGGSAIANELLQRSELIVAFQSTAVIEGMLLGRNIIYTYWDSLVDRLQDDLLPFHEADGICIVRKFSDFNQICSRYLSGNKSEFEFSPEQIAGRERFVDRYFHKPDGQVCERFLSQVKGML